MESCWNGVSLDTGLLVVDMMNQKGWFPHDIALLNGTQVRHVSVLYYLGNLSPPKASLSQSSCDAEKYLAMNLEKAVHAQAHTTENCNCQSRGPD